MVTKYGKDLTNMSNLEVKIQKTELATQLEEQCKTKWDLIQQFPYDAGFDLRA